MNIIVETEISRLAETLNRLGDDLLPRAVADALNEPARLIAIHAKTNAKKKTYRQNAFYHQLDKPSRALPVGKT